jgi:mono/diheme cytochrome c family protein
MSSRKVDRKMSMMKQFFLLAALPLLLLAAPSFAQSAAQNGAPGGDAARGKDIFMKDACYTCHGTVGEGGVMGPRIAHDGMTADAIKQQLRDPQASMPAYTAKILPDDQLADIVAYIQSLSQGPAPNPKDLPLLNQ